MDKTGGSRGQGSRIQQPMKGPTRADGPLVGSLQYRTLANYMYWFPLPFQLPVVI